MQHKHPAKKDSLLAIQWLTSFKLTFPSFIDLTKSTYYKDYGRSYLIIEKVPTTKTMEGLNLIIEKVPTTKTMDGLTCLSKKYLLRRLWTVIT